MLVQHTSTKCNEIVKWIEKALRDFCIGFSSMRFLYQVFHMCRKIHISRKIQHVTRLVPLEHICCFTFIERPCKGLFSKIPLECDISFRENFAKQTSITIHSNMEISEVFNVTKAFIGFFFIDFFVVLFLGVKKC